MNADNDDQSSTDLIDATSSSVPPVIFQSRRLEFAESLPFRALLVVFGVIWPILSFLPACSKLHWINEAWQSGQLEVYAGLLLNWPTHKAASTRSWPRTGSPRCSYFASPAKKTSRAPSA